MNSRLNAVAHVVFILLFFPLAVLAQSGPQAERWNRAGKASVDAKDYPSAIEDFQKAIQLDPTNEYAWFHLGYACLEHQQFSQAESAFKRYLSLPNKPDEQLAWLLLGITYQDLKQYSNAADVFRRLIRLTNEKGLSYKAHYELGHSLCMDGQYVAAIEELQQAMQFETHACDAAGACADSGGLRSYLGISFYHLQRYPEALASFGEALRLKPHDSDINYFMGLTYVRMGRRAEALGQYQKTKLAGNDVAQDLYAQIQKMEAVDKGAQSAQSAPSRVGQSAPAAQNRNGYADQCKRSVAAPDSATAVDLCKKAVLAAPFDAEAWSDLGMAYFQSKRYSEAAQAYEQVIRLSPKDAHAQYGVGAAYVETKQYDKAVPHLREAVDLEPGNSSEWYDLGHSYYEIGEYAGAARALEQASRLLPNDGPTDYWLGRTYVQLRNKVKAQEAYERLVGSDGNSNQKLPQQLYAEIVAMKP